MAEQKIKAVYMFEILGRPPEHIKAALNEFIDKLGEIKGVKVLNKKVSEPKHMDDDESKNFYVTFGEAELEIDDVYTAFFVVFNMLPANVEILEPKHLRIYSF